jgi:hypothetical protein
MSQPVCPPNYVCTFTPRAPHIHIWHPWWETGWGLAAAIVALVALGLLVATLLDARDVRNNRKTEAREADARRAHELAMAEQQTMLADAAHGNPEVLKLIREQAR